NINNVKIPSQDIDNVITPPLSSYGIAYVPKAFNVNSKLSPTEASQSIKLTGNFHVGVRDLRGTNSSWQLTAHLQWDKKQLPGAEILTTGNVVKKNTNNGIDDFKESDLKDCPSTDVFALSNIVIGSTQSKPFMIAQQTGHGAVYDYNLGQVTLRINNPKNVEADNYQGNVVWDLSNVMS
ncbi:hypothetical protein G8B32_13430, partial [Enterococcus faecalis]|uniref:WxL domain-containing protein n=1 Tax=Enterococcus faecalis TaxID=1351 RepID=UPI001883DF70